METYPSINGSTSKSYPSLWYAFDAGPARFYVLTASWADGNIGTGSVYKNDRDAHWAPSSAEYRWLQSDLAAHPNALKFAFWHYPLYADSSSQPSDTFLQGGPGTLQGLLDANNVAMVFNGHAHGYQRSKPDSAGLVSHVVGNGGAALGSVSGCSSYDLYAIGHNGSHCGAAPATTPDSEVYGFVKVTVNGRTVTVTPTSSTGRTYDVQTYTFPGSEPDSTAPTPPTTLTPTVVSTSRIDLSWSGASDNVGVTGYQIYRAEGTAAPVKLAEQTGTTFSDTTTSPSTDYTYSVYAIDAAGNRSAAKTATASTTGAPDGTPPSQPGNLTASAPSSSVVNLSWTASTDNVGVVGYNVYRNGTLISQPITTPDPNPPTTYNDETAQPSTTYTYAVTAVDAAGNESTPASKSVTTPPASGGGGTFTFAPTDDAYVDSSVPTTNFGTATRLTADNSPQANVLLKFNVAGLPSGCAVSSAKLQLTVASTTNDNSPYGGDLYGSTNTTWAQSTVNWNSQPAAAATKTSSVATAVALSTAYIWDAKALISGNGLVTFVVKSTSSDGARYYSTEGGTAAQDPVLSVVCGSGGGPTDTTPPSPPGTPTATAASSTQVNLSWPASSDDVGVTGYRVYRNGSTNPLGSPTPTSYADTAVVAGTSYTYTVSAVDAAGNESAKSAAASVTTPAAGGGGTFTFAPTDDASVDSSVPTTNFGTATRLTADNSPQVNVLLKFNVAGLPSGCAVSSAKLQLTVGSTTNDNSPYGGDLYGSTNTTWAQSTVNWNTQPAAAATKTSSVATAVALSTAYIWDAKALISGNGLVTFVVKSTSSDGARYYSTEGGTAAQDPVLTVVCGSGGGPTDTTPPSTPGTPTATAASSTRGNLSWPASSDDVGVTGSRVYRNGSTTPLGSPTTTSYADSTVVAGTSYTYTVSAVDAAGNESAKSAAASVTTPAAGGGGTFTFAPTDDAYVDSSVPTTNFGTATRLTADNSPQSNVLLRFNVAGLPSGCAVSSAKLQLTVGSTTNDNSPYGGDLYGSTNTTWAQSTVNWNSQPAAAATKTSSVATSVAISTAYVWDAKPLVTGNGVVTFVVKSTSSDGARYYSSEGGTAAQDPVLTVTCG